jgi:predicted O-methyltransferase YrrM
VDKTIGFLKNIDLDTINVIEYKDLQEIKRLGTFDLIFYDLGYMDIRRAEFRNVVERYLKPKSILIADDLHNDSYKCVLEGVSRELNLQVYDLSEVTKDSYGRYSVAITL